MKLSIEPGDYVVLIEINKEVLKCSSFEEVDQADRIRYELVSRMSERLPAEVIVPSIIDYIRFGSGYIGDYIIWDAETESFFCQQFETIDGSPLGEDLEGFRPDPSRVELARYYTYLTIGRIIEFDMLHPDESNYW
ncbi:MULTISPECIES: hypothetical protein [unclassified Exiguobacterium]|uniref:hypothetical protein n=1 Tax=unclassified Exiguobacterium TaxID=2644629 RepID=UPI001BE7C8FD|nr:MULTISPECIES: hypothetical protein [unclassified Exiguobacterium]